MFATMDFDGFHTFVLNRQVCEYYSGHATSGGRVTLDATTQMQVFFGGSERINLIADWTATQFAATFEDSLEAKQPFMTFMYLAAKAETNAGKRS